MTANLLVTMASMRYKNGADKYNCGDEDCSAMQLCMMKTHFMAAFRRSLRGLVRGMKRDGITEERGIVTSYLTVFQ